MQICYMTNPLCRNILFLSRRASTGSVTSEAKSVTSPVTNKKKNAYYGGLVGKEVVIFFSTKLYRDHIESYLSAFGYSVLVQGRFEKMAFFLVDQHCWEALAVRCHHKATEDAGNWVGRGGVGSCHCWVKYNNQLVGATRSIPGNVFQQTVAGLGRHHQQQ
jgi:hypothetical protein